MRRRSFLMGGKQEANTIIGGVGSVITTKSALATKLGISESIIRRFEVVGDDVHAIITQDYNLPTNLFDGDTDIEYFQDFEGKAYFETGTTAFRNSTIKKFESYNVNSLAVPAYFASGSQIEELIVPFVIRFNSSAVDGATNLHTINAPIVTNFLTYACRNTTSLVNVNFKPQSFLQGVFQNSNAILDLTELHTIGQAALNNNKYTSMSLPSLISVTSYTPFGNNQLCVDFYANNLETIGDSLNFFLNWYSAELIEMKMLKTYGAFSGGGTGQQYGFSTLKTGCTIRVNEAMATANAGNPHEAFLWVKANRGATVEFYDDDGNYVSTL